MDTEKGTTHLLETSSDTYEGSTDPLYTPVDRILHLINILAANNRTRAEVLEQMREYYYLDEGNGRSAHTSSQSAARKFSRDIKFLENTGYEIQKSGSGSTARYNLLRGPALTHTFFFDHTELATLSLLSTLFVDPTPFTQPDSLRSISTPPSPRNPFTEDILSLVARLVTTLPAEQKRDFDRLAQRPHVYFNLNTAVDYLPHRATIDKIAQAIRLRQRIRFEYSPAYRSQSTHHHEVDPYHITYLDGHFYLLGYSYKMNKFFEHRIDRIKKGSIDIRNETINPSHRQHIIEFRYWADESLTKSGLSQRWITATIEKSNVSLNLDETKRKRGAIIKATAYSEWRILQQLHKYGDKVVLLDPPQLREKMFQEVERMYNLYRPEISIEALLSNC